MSSDETAIPDEAIEAALPAMGRIYASDAAATRAILAAALPVLRRHIADEIEAQARREAEAYDPEVQPLAAEYREWWHVGMASAARVVRDGDNG